MEKRIRMLLIEKDVSISEMANRLNTTQSNFSKKLKRNNFTVVELEKIAEVLGEEFVCYFQLKDGKRI